MKKSDILFTFLPLVMAVALLFCFASPAISGEPLGMVYFYNVYEAKFSVVWQVDTPSTCNVEVYTDAAGTSPASATIYPRTNYYPTAQDRGVMQVDVTGLQFATTYYVRTVSTGKATGPFTDTNTYYYPDFGFPLLTVRTAVQETSPVTWKAGFLVAVYDPDTGINTSDWTQNTLSDIVVIVDVDAYYPLSYSKTDPQTNGWPVVSGGGYYVPISFPAFVRYPETGAAWDWSLNKTDHPMDIIILGGLVPDIGLGQRIIHTTYPMELIGNQYGDCLSTYAVQNPPEDCDGAINQYVLFANQRPQLIVPAEDTTDPLDTGIPAYYDEQLPLPICAYDPEGDVNISFSLSGEPDWMSLQTSFTDANCFEITGTPERSGIYRNIKLRVSDSNWATAYYTFTLIVTNWPPTSSIDYQMDLPAGWSMISLPVDPIDPRAGTLFPDATAIFKHTTTGYELLDLNDHMVKGTGYWIFLPLNSLGTYTITGYPIEELTITNLPPGWSMIGGCTDPATASAIGGRIRGIFGFTNRYVHLGASDTLQPGKGFWINISESSTLNLDTL